MTAADTVAQTHLASFGRCDLIVRTERIGDMIHCIIRLRPAGCHEDVLFSVDLSHARQTVARLIGVAGLAAHDLSAVHTVVRNVFKK